MKPNHNPNQNRDGNRCSGGGISKGWWRSATVLLLLFGILWAAGGCRRIRNPNPELVEKRDHFLFLNYSLKGPSSQDESSSDDLLGGISREFVGGKLKIFARRDLIPSVVLQQFALRSGANVSIEPYDSSAMMYDRLKAGETFDIIMPAFYMVKRLKEEKIIGELDLNSIPNRQGMTKRFTKLSNDHDEHDCLAYLWTTMGIAYHYEYFDDRPHTWKEFFEPGPEVKPWVEGKVAIPASARQSFAAGLVRLGFSPNSVRQEELAQAETYLTGQMKNFMLYDDHDIGKAFADETVVMAQVTSANVARMHDSSVIFSIPQDGSWLYLDTFTISSKITDRQKRLAQTFINYMMEPIVAAAVVDYSHHASTIAKAKAFISSSAQSRLAYIEGDLRSTFILTTDGKVEAFQETASSRFYPLARQSVKKKESAFAEEPPKPHSHP